MTRYRRRERIRERVAARKANARDAVPSNTDDGVPSPWRARLRWTGLILQVVATLLVLLEILKLVDREFANVNYIWIVVLVGLFFTGRLIHIGLTLTRKAR